MGILEYELDRDHGRQGPRPDRDDRERDDDRRQEGREQGKQNGGK